MATNLAISNAETRPTAQVDGDRLLLDGFEERDPQVLVIAREAEDVEGLIHDCLAIGARALTAAQATTDVAVVEKAFGDMTSAFSRDLDTFTGELDARTKELLDGDEGALPLALEGFKGELERLLDGTFDPDSKRSALAKIDDVMRRVSAEQVSAVRGLLDADNEESPLGRYRSEIVKSVREETAKVQQAIQELSTHLAVEEARAEVFELTTQKGFAFEDRLESTLIGICQPLGDVAERVGGTTGVRGKKGDFRVALNPEDVAGQEMSYALEAKNQRLNLRDTLREIDRAITNRGALAGIAVFARASQCPGDEPFQSYGGRAIVVYDPENGDDLALRLACCWARWVVRRQLGSGADTIDLERVGALLEDGRQALRTRSTIDRALTTSANKITEARNHLETLVAQVESALSSIENELAA